MSSSFKKLSKIDKRTKYSVYGWIREMEQALDLSQVPMMISSICILYFHKDPIFDSNLIGTSTKLSADKKCITKGSTNWENIFMEL